MINMSVSVRLLASSSLLSFLSQVVGAACLVLLPFLGGDVSDLYVVGIQCGTAAFSGVVLGVLYPYALGRPRFEYWTKVGICAGLSSFGFAALAWAGLPTGDNLRFSALQTLPVYAVGGAILAWTGTRAVRLSLLGNNLPLASLTIAPNLGMLLGLVVMLLWNGGHQFIFLPPLLWATGSAVSAIIANCVSRSSQPYDVSAFGPHIRSSGLHLMALVLGVVSSTVLPTLVLTSSTALASGIAATLYTTVRIINALLVSTLNAFLYTHFNWNTKVRVAPAVYNVGAMISVATGSGALVALWYLRSVEIVTALLIVTWIVTVAIGSLALREINFRGLGGTVMAKVAVDAILSMAAYLLFVQNAMPHSYICTFIVSQSVTIAVCCLRAKAPWATFGATVTLGLSLLTMTA